MPREHSSLCNGGWCNTVAAGRRTFRRVIGDVAVSRAGMGQHEQAPASRCSGRRVVLGKSAQGVGLYDGWQATVGGRASSKTADANRSQTGRWHLRDRAIPTTESGRSTRAAARCLLSACARRPSDSRRYWRRGCRPDRTHAPPALVSGPPHARSPRRSRRQDPPLHSPAADRKVPPTPRRHDPVDSRAVVHAGIKRQAPAQA